MVTRRRLRAFACWVPGLAVVAVGLALTYGLVQKRIATDAATAQLRFNQEVRSSTDAISQRIAAYTEVVAGLRDLFIINPYLTSHQFDQVVGKHGVRERYPEIKNLSFVRKVADAALPAFEAGMRVYADQHGIYRSKLVHPVTGHIDHYIVQYVWPHKGNEDIWGLDIASQPADVAALLMGRYTGKPAVSAPFNLALGKKQDTGFVLRFPVFVSVGSGPDQPRRRFIGAVAAAVRVSAMLHTVAASGFLRGVMLRIDDLGPLVNAPDPVAPMLLGMSSSRYDATATHGLHREVRVLNVHGRRWKLGFVPARPFLSPSERLLPWWMGGGGIALTLLLAALVTLLARQRSLALADVETSQRALARSEIQLLDILDHLPVGVIRVENSGKILFRNQRFVEICGYTEQDVPDMMAWWMKAYPDPSYRESARVRWDAACKLAFAHDGIILSDEYHMVRKDGARCVVEVSGAMFTDIQIITVEDVSQRKVAEERINYLAYYDPLTQLPNRRFLSDRLQQVLTVCAKRQRSGALLLLDIDHFKVLNETQGHDVGDQLLCQIATRLLECAETAHTVARHGDDEFVVLLEGLPTDQAAAAAEAEGLGRWVLAALRQPYTLGNRVYHATASLGIVLFHGQAQVPAECPAQLLQHADVAMNQAKGAGRNTLMFYDPHTQAMVSARAKLELDMRVGLQQAQFELYYQPQIENGEVTGAEALLRWHHPENGFVSPASFIPLAEESGLIVPLGKWVLQSACHQLALWRSNPVFAKIALGVNVSAKQFHQADFVEQVLDVLRRTGARAQQLRLELTESVLLQDVDDTIAKIEALKRHGVEFSLDDFGTGYSSLVYLKRLPLDELKIDQGFVRDVLTDANDAAIARTIVALGDSLGLRVVAEGVETEAQRAFLEQNHCTIWQGYLFSKPVTVAEFENFVMGPHKQA